MVITGEKLKDDLEFIRKSEEEAKKYEWLYHCTKMEVFLDIVKEREFWLSNPASGRMNDENEKCDELQYQNAYYIGSFTCKQDITENHWIEYADMDKGVPGILFGLKKEWFTKNYRFIINEEKNEEINDGREKTKEEEFKIFQSYGKMADYLTKNKYTGIPFYVEYDRFRKVEYDDKIKKDLSRSGYLSDEKGDIPCKIYIPGIHGIIKKKEGECKREWEEGYIKNWEEEDEIRLQVCVKTNYKDINKNGIFIPRMAVSLSDSAFTELPIRFSPNMSEEEKKNKMDEIRAILPEAKIWEI